MSVSPSLTNNDVEIDKSDAMIDPFTCCFVRVYNGFNIYPKKKKKVITILCMHGSNKVWIYNLTIYSKFEKEL